MNLSEKLIFMIRWNGNISSFNRAFVGMNIWVFIGMLNLPIYASILRISVLLGMVVSGIVEQKIATMDDKTLREHSVFAEALSICIYSLGNVVIVFHFITGLLMLLIGNILYGYLVTTNRVNRNRILIKMFKSKVDRNILKGSLRIWVNVSQIIGLGLNLLIMTIGSIYNLDQMFIVKCFLVSHGFIGVIDFTVSYIERRYTRAWYKENTDEE